MGIISCVYENLASTETITGFFFPNSRVLNDLELSCISSFGLFDLFFRFLVPLACIGEEGTRCCLDINRCTRSYEIIFFLSFPWLYPLLQKPTD